MGVSSDTTERPGWRKDIADVDSYDERAEAYVGLLREGTLGQLMSRLARRLLHLSGDVSGRGVLDAGCGEGHLARLFAGHGANVVGVDVAPRMIEAARSHPDSHHGDITFLEADLTRGLPAYREHFDLVVANMVLDGVADHLGFLHTVSEALAPDGRFLLSLNNPHSAVPRDKVETYFASGSVGCVFGTERAGFEAPYYHRTFEDLMTAFRTSGFLLRTLEDVGPDPQNPAPPSVSVPSLMILELVRS